jgi:hypothetical protein
MPYALPMKGLRRNDDAMKTNAGIVVNTWANRETIKVNF